MEYLGLPQIHNYLLPIIFNTHYLYTHTPPPAILNEDNKGLFCFILFPHQETEKAKLKNHPRISYPPLPCIQCMLKRNKKAKFVKHKSAKDEIDSRTCDPLCVLSFGMIYGIPRRRIPYSPGTQRQCWHLLRFSNGRDASMETPTWRPAMCQQRLESAWKQNKAPLMVSWSRWLSTDQWSHWSRLSENQTEREVILC